MKTHRSSPRVAEAISFTQDILKRAHLVKRVTRVKSTCNFTDCDKTGTGHSKAAVRTSALSRIVKPLNQITSSIDGIGDLPRTLAPVLSGA
jgi:hypothetical protein